MKFRNLVPTLLLTASLTLAACGNRSEGPGQIGECSSNGDCPAATPLCSAENTCVECTSNAECECNEVCGDGECLPLGVVPELLGISGETLPDPTNAHGVWRGAPGTDAYRFVGFCNSTSDCPTGEVCNSLTRGCVSASAFPNICESSDECPSGLLCDPANSLCLPAALCLSNANCCGLPDVSCQAFGDSGASLCLPVGDECTPPAASDLTSQCPQLPVIQAECLTGEFCNPDGRCVQCGCDADCDGTGFPICDVTDGSCVGCLGDEDCGSGETCDPQVQLCRETCTTNSDCPFGEFCDPEDSVCRSAQDLPCVQDTNEPNQTLEQAIDGAFSLAVPAPGEMQRIEDLGLCLGDDFDYFTVQLVRGDFLRVSGSSTTPLEAELRALAPDRATRIDTGRISINGNEPLEIVANFTGTYFIGVSRLQNVGNYALTLARSTANPGDLCNDTFEDANGRNDTLASATLLNDDAAPPDGCTVNGSLGSSQTVQCLGNPHRMCLGEADYYELVTPVGATVIANVNGSSGDLDAILYGPFVGDEAPTSDRIADTSNSIGTNERLEDSSRTGGRYYLYVFRTTGQDPTYSVSVSIEAGAVCVDDRFDEADAADPLDPPSFNDVFTTATGIALVPDANDEVVAAVDAVNVCRLDVDWYRLGLDDGVGGLAPFAPNQELVVSVSGVSPGPPSNVIVLGGADPSTLEAEVNRDTPSITSPTFSVRPTEATEYYVAVRPADLASGPFDYVLDIALSNPPTCTPDLGDDEPANATVLSGTEGLQEGLNLCIDDVAYYQIPVTADQRVIAQVLYDPVVSRIAARGYDDTVLGASTPDGERVPVAGQRDDSAVEGSGFQWLDFDLGGTAGDAYLVVYNQERWVADYDLDVTLAPVACVEDEFEIAPGNNQWDDATPVTLQVDPVDGREQRALLGPLRVCTASGGEQDWYAVDLAPGDRLRGTFYSSPDDGQLDLNFRLPGPFGATSSGILETIDGPESGARFVASIDYTVPAEGAVGDYLLQVQPQDPAGDDQFDNVYFLDLQVTRVCPEDPFEPSSQALPFALGGAADFDTLVPLSEDAALCRDEDWYALEVPASRTVTVCLDFVHAEGDIDLFVYDALTPVDGDGLPTSLVAQSRQNIAPEVATFTSPATAQTYYLRAALDVNEDEKNTTYRLQVAEGTTCP